MNTQKKICIAYLGNPFHDSRLTNLQKSLKEDGCKVSVISFDWFISRKNYFDDAVKVFKLTKGKISLFFYLSFARILIRELVKTDADIFFAEDIYTLPFVFIIAKLKLSIARKFKKYSIPESADFAANFAIITGPPKALPNAIFPLMTLPAV